VRTVNAYYEDGVFYVVTHALSNKMKQIKKSPAVAVCGEWFAARGIGENLGCIRAEANAIIAAKLREIFAAWYDNGHTDENDTNTCILRIRLTDCVIFKDGAKYEIDFEKCAARKEVKHDHAISDGCGTVLVGLQLSDIYAGTGIDK
jgi:general stress protein 26